jgi:hypothetical protein
MKVEMRLRAASVDLPTEPGGSDEMRLRHIPLAGRSVRKYQDAEFPFLRRIGHEILCAGISGPLPGLSVAIFEINYHK